MLSWLGQNILPPHAIVFIGIIITVAGEGLRFYAQKNEKTKLKGFGFFFIILGIIITGSGGLLSAIEQNKFEKDLMGMITGGDSFVRIEPIFPCYQNKVRFMLIYTGEYPVYDVSVHIRDETKMKSLSFPKIPPEAKTSKKEYQKFRKERDITAEFDSVRQQALIRFHAGNIYPKTGREFGPYDILQKDPITGKPEQEYLITIFARNGTITQQLKGLRKNGYWLVSTRVTRKGSDGKEKILREVNSPEVPLDTL